MFGGSSPGGGPGGLTSFFDPEAPESPPVGSGRGGDCFVGCDYPTGGGASSGGSGLCWTCGSVILAAAGERDTGAGRGWWHRHASFGKGYENAARFFRDKFNAPQDKLMHLFDRGHAKDAWGITGTPTLENRVKLEQALRVHMADPSTRVFPGTQGGQKLDAVHFYNPTTGRVVSMNPHTGGLQTPTGYQLSPKQVNLLEGTGHVGVR